MKNNTNQLKVVAICETCNTIEVCILAGETFTCEDCLGLIECNQCGDAFIPETSGFFVQDELCGACLATIQYGEMGEL